MAGAVGAGTLPGEMFLEHLVGIFDECRRVLKSTGTLWVNLGGSYSKLNKYNRTDDWPPGKTPIV